MIKITQLYILSLLLFTALSSCRKSAFLNAKPDQSLVIPQTLEDCQDLLNNDVVMNGVGNSGYPSLGQTGCDDYYVSSAWYNGYSTEEQQAIIWAQDIYKGGAVNDWDLTYRTVLYANEALSTLAGLHPTDDQQIAWNNAKGGALFFRAFSFYSLAQIFAPVYDSGSASRDAGICLRLQANTEEKLSRATVQQTYDQIITDLREAIPLLPLKPLSHTTQPYRAAAYGLLARVYLSAGDYRDAGSYADSCLQLQSTLMDYNTITPQYGNPSSFTRSNVEVIFDAAYYANSVSVDDRSYTDSLLYGSYGQGDLRKDLFFYPGFNLFIGRYDEDGFSFCGLATDEMYLIRAECYARAGNTTAAMNDLNTLMITRWTQGSFVPYTAIDAWDAFLQILQERRKELLYRGLRWTDLRRLNKDTRTALPIKRTVQGLGVYELLPNSPRYVYAIPDYVIQDNPGMTQNIR